jgi:hypothetical protein
MDTINPLARPIRRPASALVLVACIVVYMCAVAFGVSVLLHAIGAVLTTPCVSDYGRLWLPCS